MNRLVIIVWLAWLHLPLILVKRDGLTIQVEFGWFLPYFERIYSSFSVFPSQGRHFKPWSNEGENAPVSLNSRVPVKREQELHVS